VLIQINKWFPSSQLCNECGYQNKEIKDYSIREWECPACDMYHDRDINAAINIKNEGLRLLSA
jgi:putative transposase